MLNNFTLDKYDTQDTQPMAVANDQADDHESPDSRQQEAQRAFSGHDSGSVREYTLHEESSDVMLEMEVQQQTMDISQ